MDKTNITDIIKSELFLIIQLNDVFQVIIKYGLTTNSESKHPYFEAQH